MTKPFSYEEATAPTEQPSSFSYEAATGKPEKDATLGERVGFGFKRALSATQTALTDDPTKIAKQVAETAAEAPRQSAAAAQMQAEIKPYVEAANKAEGVVDTVKGYGILAAKRAGQLISNPGEAGKMIAEQLPNSLPGMVGGIAGAKGGAALGSVFGPVGTAAGAVIGGVAGGLAGGYLTEKGSSVQEQVQKKAQEAGVNIQDQRAVSELVRNNQPEIDSAAALKGLGTAGTDAVLNVLTVGLSGMGRRMLGNEIGALAGAVKAGQVTATDAAKQLAALEAKAVAQGGWKQVLGRGAAVTTAEMLGEGASEAVGQKLAYGSVDAGEVVDESLLGLGQGVGMAAASGAYNKLAGTPDQNTNLQRIEALRNAIGTPGAEQGPGLGFNPNATQPSAEPQPAPFVNPASLTGNDAASLLGGQNAGLTGSADPLRAVVTPSQAMGIDPNAGPLSTAAAMAVDGPASMEMAVRQAERDMAALAAEDNPEAGADPLTAAPDPLIAQVAGYVGEMGTASPQMVAAKFGVTTKRAAELLAQADPTVDDLFPPPQGAANVSNTDAAGALAAGAGGPVGVDAAGSGPDAGLLATATGQRADGAAPAPRPAIQEGGAAPVPGQQRDPALKKGPTQTKAKVGGLKEFMQRKKAERANVQDQTQGAGPAAAPAPAEAVQAPQAVGGDGAAKPGAAPAGNAGVEAAGVNAAANFDPAGWEKVERKPLRDGSMPPSDVYRRAEDGGTRTVVIRDGEVAQDGTATIYDTTDLNGDPMQVRVLKNNLTQAVEAFGLDEDGRIYGDPSKLNGMLDIGLTIGQAINRVFSTDDAPAATLAKAQKKITTTEPTNGTAQPGAAPAGPAAVEATGVADAGFDSAAWDKARNDTIKASKAAGNKHLDELPAYVESMRGKKVYYAHDNKVQGVIRTVDNRGNVYIDWSDDYSAKKEMASPAREGKKTVMRSSIGPTDLKDYVVGDPKKTPSPTTTEPTDAPRSPAPAQAVETKAQGQQAPAADAAVTEPPDAGQDEAGANWNRMTTVEREAVALRTGIKGVAAKNVATRGWQGLDRVVQERLAKAMANPKAPAAAPVSSQFTGEPDQKNSAPTQELDGFKVGDAVDIPSRTFGVGKIETLFTREMAGFGPMGMARVVRDDGKKLDVLTSELKAVAAPAPAPSPSAANTKPDPAVREKLMAIAKRLGVAVNTANGGFKAGGGAVDIPAEDAQVEGALSPNHVAAHELAHAAMQKRGISFQGHPIGKIKESFIPNWDALVAASKAFRPAVWSSENQRIKDHARKPNEVIADAIGSVYLGLNSLSLLEPMMKGTGTTEFDLGLKDAPSVAAPAPTQQAQAPEEPQETTHNGTRIYRTRAKLGDEVKTMWAVESPENKARRAAGERTLGGDTLHDTIEQAKAAADREAKQYAERKAFAEQQDAAERARKEADEARKASNRGKSILERRKDAILDGDTKLPASAGLGNTTRRNAMQMAVEQGRAVVERQVDDTASKKRDQDAIERVRRAGYMLGLSNENIPVVKAGLEAQARLKANDYKKPEYRVYAGSEPTGGFFEITKIEYEYAQELMAQKAAKPAVAPAPEPATQADEFLPEGWTKSINGYTKRPVYRMEQGGGQPFAVVTQTEGMTYEVQIRHGDKQLTNSTQRGALSEVLSGAKAELAKMTQAASVTHQDPGEKPEAATKGVVNDSLKTAAKNEDTKPSEMRKWLLAEIDKELLQAPDRADYDEAVKRMGEKDAISMYTGNGPLGRAAETGFITFDVPGDGKFKVRNSVRGLLEFRKNVSASMGFKDSGQKQAKPDQNDGVQGGSGGQMAAVTNMIEEGDFEAARDYAEAVGIKLEDVKVPRGDMKPAWDKFLKDGVVPEQRRASTEWSITNEQNRDGTWSRVARLKRKADGVEYEATVTGSLDNTRATYVLTKDGKEYSRLTNGQPFSAAIELAENAMPEANDKPAPSKASDTGWNMAGTGYGGKRYRGRNITLADGREVVARIYENAGNYDEVEVKVDGARKFTVRDSFNAQDKADAFIKTLTSKDGDAAAPVAEPSAPAGRTYLAVPFNEKDYAKRAGAKWDEGNKLWYADPVGGDGAAAGEININLQQYIPRDSTKDDRYNYYGDKALATAVAINASARDGIQYDIIKRKHPDGMMMWSVVKAGEQTQAAPAAQPAIPDGYRPAGEPFYRDGELTQGYAPFDLGQRVTMKESGGQSGVIDLFTSPDKNGVFDGAMVKFDNGVEQIVKLNKLEAEAAPAATGTRRDPTKVTMFNPYNDGDIVTIDGQDWTVKADTPGWYLTTNGNWRGQHPTIRNVKAMADLIREVEQAAEAKPAAAQADTPKLTQAEAKELMEWQDLGQKDGIKTHILTFYESKADKDAKRGRMVVATVTKEADSKTWVVEGTDDRLAMLAMAKKKAEDAGMARAVADGFVEPSAAESDYASTAEQVEAAKELLLPIRQGETVSEEDRQTLESLLKIPSLKGFDQPTARRLLMIAGATKAAIEKVMRTNPVSIDDLATELGKATGETEKKKAFDRAFNAASQIAQTDPKVKELLDIYNVEKSILDGIASERGLYGVKWAERNVSSRWTGQSQKVRSVKQRLVDAVNKAAPSGVRQGLAGVRAKKAAEAEAQRATYFTPGNIVKGYGGYDRVLEYTPVDERGTWSVRVQRVVKQGDGFVDAPRETPRWHSTQPEAKELAAGPVVKAPAAAQESPAPAAQPATVENFGEKLPPARRAMAAKLSESLSDDSIAKLPLSQIWPASENEAIEDTFAAAVAHVMREAIPAKPRTAYKVNSWVNKVKMLRDFAAKILRGTVTKDFFMEEMAKFSALRDLRSKIKLLEQIDRAQWKRIGDVSEAPSAVRYEEGKPIPSPSVSVSVDGKNHWLRGSGDVLTHLDAIKAMLGTDAPESKMQFEIRQESRGERKVFINKKGDKEYRRLMEFATVDEARKAIREQYADLVAAWEGVKARDNITERDLRSDTNRERVGKDHRKGRDVTAEEFESKFGFRGGEFGKWVGQGKGAQERQFMLNSAYDALMDLSDLLGIPPKAISLEGSLGIAFGSRGSGWASAHFEPSNLVINLTKTRGAGALAHEWFHALDNYFARKRGGEVPFDGDNNAYRRNNYVTYKTTPLMVRKDGRGTPVSKERLAEWRKTSQNAGYLAEDQWMEDPNHKQGVRAEVEQAFSDLVKTLNDSPMLKRAQTLDGVGRNSESDGYWSRVIERAARAFENYVQTRMMEQGYHNDFLANVKVADEVGKNTDRYPYLLPSEIAPVADAFQALFDTIQTKEDDAGNVVMFSRAQAPAAGIPVQTAQQIVDAIAKRWDNAPAVVVLADMNDPRVPEAVRKRDAEQRSGGAKGAPEGFFYKGTAYVVAGSLKTPGDVVRVLLHESLGHYGLRGVFGDALGSILNQIAALRKSEVVAKAKEYGLVPNGLPENASVAEVYAAMSEGQRQQAAEEVLAVMAQSNPQAGFVKRAIGAIRAWLRENIPGLENMRLTDNDIVTQFILPARRFVQQGPAARVGDGVLAMSRGKNEAMPVFNNASGDFNPDLDKYWIKQGKKEINGEGMSDADYNTAVAEYANQWRINDLLEQLGWRRRGSSNLSASTYYQKDIELDEPNADGEDTLTYEVRVTDHDDYHPADATITKRFQIGFRADEARWADAAITPDMSTADAISLLRGTLEIDPSAPVSGGAMFSRSPRELAGMATDQLKMTLTAPGKLSWWHKSVGTMYNLAERHPAFKPVFNAAQSFIDDVSYYATDAADLAPKMLPKLESWKDIAKSPISAEDNKAIEAPINEGTLLWARDESGRPVKVAELEAQAADMTADQKARRLLRNDKINEGVLRMWQGLPQEQYEKLIDSRYQSQMLTPGVVWTDAELKAIWKLNDAQIGLYREVRAAIDKSLDNLAKSDLVRFVGKDGAGIKDAIMEAGSVDEAALMARDYFIGLSEAEPDRAEMLLATANGIMDRADKVTRLKEQGYAPLSRFGKYTVDVVTEEGRQYFGLFESMREANQMAARMRGEFGKDAVSQGTLSDESFKLFQGITPETLELFGNMLGLSDTGDTPQDQAFQAYLKLTKNNRSAMKRLIQRKGILGYSQDVGRVLANFIYSNARQTAGALHIGDLTEAVNAIPQSQGELKDEAVRLAEYIQNPQEEAQAFRGLLFAQYLGGSIAAAMVNMTQPLQVSLPYLSQFGGAGAAGKELMRAIKGIATGKKDYEPDLARALKHAEEDGTVSPQEVHQLMAQARGAGTLRSGDGTKLGDALAKGGNAWAKMSLAWGKVFGVAEQMNRRSTFIAAYRLAKAQKMADPAGFAKKAVHETQFIYSKANKMRWGRGAIGGVAMTFKSYSVSYLELLHRMATQGGPEGKRAAMLAVAVLLVMGGAGGLPFMEDAEDITDAIAQVMGYNFSTKQAKQELLQDLFGEAAGQFIERGVSGLPGVPLDVTGRLGMGNLIPGTGMFLQKNSNTRDVLEIAGPAGDLAQRVMNAGGMAVRGNLAGAALELSPKAIRDLAKGADMANTGMYRDAKGFKVIDTTAGEAGLKAIGFQPNTVAQVQEANYLMQRQKDYYNATAQSIRAKWARGLFEKDEAMVAEAREEIATWNEKNPDQRMSPNMPAIWRRVREMAKDKDQRIADTAPKAMRQQFREETARVRETL